MAGPAEEEHEGASPQEQLIEACRRNNTDLLAEVLAGRSEADAARLLNETTTVLGNHLYHEAAAQGNYEVIDVLLDQPGFECDPVTRRGRDTPLHTIVRWANSEPPAQQPFARALVSMMLEAGANPRLRNAAGQTPAQLVDPRYTELRQLLQQQEYALLNAGDFVDTDALAPPAAPAPAAASKNNKTTAAAAAAAARSSLNQDDDDDDAAEFSGSDEEERAEWERRRRARRGKS
ncbi:Ankyrin repeat-containing domain protein [Niveomyces insectorum RCEF 264]|uniref:Ankyrin repeat-containing domain protein n=1 Tax=Niveomyces insectorum RCEF 264 TaxID=1081102 RepID=A0A167VCN0_9HYPO|nr:Ankyrin repeat-containing domain protein [Niveomyces insectorum RCEF 264]